MKKKELIKTLMQRVEELEKIVKPHGITFTNPENENKKVFVGIKEGKFTQDALTEIPSKTETVNITNQLI